MSEEKNEVVKTKPKRVRVNKLCVKCNKVKPLEGGYYKCAKSWQKLCKICHNARRIEYEHSNKAYVKTPTGFLKLPEEIQQKIKYDISVFINFKEIYKKYKGDCPKLNYQTLLTWERKGLIPNYVEPLKTE
jgi:hypothetical protein